MRIRYGTGLSHLMILCYLLSALFSRVVLPTLAENILPALPLGEPTHREKREDNKLCKIIKWHRPGTVHGWKIMNKSEHWSPTKLGQQLPQSLIMI